MTKVMVLSVLMMCVTAPSRILPVFFLGNRKLPQFAESLLHYVPFAILGALIFPDVLSASDNIYSSAAGALTALFLAWMDRGILIVLTGGILATFITSQIPGF
jgi:branched-subunit amino acid transport protein